MLDRLLRQREPMSRVDTAWLRMEKPTNLMMITGIIVLAEALTLERLRELVGKRFLEFRRFRQRAIDLPGQSFWELDADFDLNWHVRRTALPGGAGKAELEEFVSQLASSPLDHSKPLWQFHLVENYLEGPALVSRIHHCYADGIALVQVLLALADEHPDGVHHPIKAKVQRAGGTVFQRLLDHPRAGVGKAAEASIRAVEKVFGLLGHPQQLMDLARNGANEVGEIAGELVNALTLPDDPATLYRGPLGVSKRVSWCTPIALDEVKAVGRAFNCTVNDVLMSCAAGALRAYLIERGEDPTNKDIRATVPVNLRPLEHARELGNYFGLVYLDLPVGQANPVTRLHRVRASMQKLKKSRQAVVSLGLLSALGMGPAMLQRPALEMFSRKASTVATNVPGPQHAMYLAGCRIKEMMFWVPQTGSIGMGISILSYHGNVYFGLITDKKNVPDPNRIIDHFRPELEQLLLLALLHDQAGPITPEYAEQLIADGALGRPGSGAKQSAEQPRAQSETARSGTRRSGARQTKPGSGVPVAKAARQRDAAMPRDKAKPKVNKVKGAQGKGKQA